MTAPDPARRVRVLYVEDAVEFRKEMISRYLADCEVTEASSVLAARLVLDDPGGAPFDLVLLDYELPDGTGADILYWIRAHAPDLRVIAVSANRKYNSILSAAGAAAALQKCDFHRLREVVGLL